MYNSQKEAERNREHDKAQRINNALKTRIKKRKLNEQADIMEAKKREGSPAPDSVPVSISVPPVSIQIDFSI